MTCFCQAEPSCVLSSTKQLLLRAISQTPVTALSSGQLRQVSRSYSSMHVIHRPFTHSPSPLLPVQLESRCADLDPELAAALSVQLEPPGLSPEMDFL